MNSMRINHPVFALLAWILIAFSVSSCQKSTSIQDLPMCQVNHQSNKVCYKTFGDGTPAIVFVHGFGCDMMAWDYQFPYFKDKNQMVFIDLPGYGKSDKPDVCYDLDYLAASVKSVLDTLNISKAVLVGHSLGTPVCRRVVQNYPESQASLCDVDGVYCFYPKDSTEYIAYCAQIDAFTEAFRDDSSYRDRVSGFAESLFTAATPQAVKDYAMKTMPETSARVAYSTMKNLVDEKYWDQSVISVPTLVLAAKSSLIDENYEAVMQSLYSNMRYQEWDTVGHFMMMEQPERFNKALDDFVNGK